MFVVWVMLVYVSLMFGCCLSLCPVSALKPEEFPEVRVEKEERQSASYEVHHQKLVRKHPVNYLQYTLVHIHTCVSQTGSVAQVHMFMMGTFAFETGK